MKNRVAPGAHFLGIPFQGHIVFVVVTLTLTLLACGVGSSPAVNVDATIAAGIAGTQQAQIEAQATINAAVAATQQATSDNSNAAANTLLTTPLAITPETTVPTAEQVRAVVLNELNGVMRKDLPLLRSLYTPEAVITDHNGTPDETGDDTIWSGWANIERRYLAFMSSGLTNVSLIDLFIQVDGSKATATHNGVIIDGTTYPDQGIYTLENRAGQWFISQLDYGNIPGYQLQALAAPIESTSIPELMDDGIYILELGNQHRYEEPWGWDGGDPCRAWETGDWDDTRPNYRGFNVELLLTNNSDEKVPDAWPITFTTANGNVVKACFYGYEGSGPRPGVTSSVTFFTVVEKGDYVERITFTLEEQVVVLCLDGKGGQFSCS